MEKPDREGPVEIALTGDLTENQGDLIEKLIEVEPGGPCVLYFDSQGGGAYSAVALASMILFRGLDATGVVAGECSSAAVWPFAACRRRLVTPYSVLLFHTMKWQSEEHVDLSEATEWARHFGQLESDTDRLLAELFDADPELIDGWSRPGRHVSGPELAEAGLAELVELGPLDILRQDDSR
jgi:ATP-dependent Clp protease, protease subunit